AKLKVKEKNVKLKTIDPEEFIKFMIKYQKTPIKQKQRKEKKIKIEKEKKSRKEKVEKEKNKERKFNFKIKLNFKLFKRR
ncbi:MAG: hypothetical protein GXO26_09135, partial [Crenarchaeota archaeon]|nr:hypothetical protein [Thermoproteota archaeon]